VAANQAKANFESVYDATTPGAYLRELAPLDYRIPDEAAPVVRRLIDEARQTGGAGTTTLLDVGCSYGINAAVLNYGTTFRAMHERYLGHYEADGRAAVAADRAFFSSLPRDRGLRVIGLDVAKNAVDYGLEAGLLDDGIVANLEEQALDAGDRRRLAGVDLVISTGCVGYVTKTTFARLVDAIAESGRPPVVASFVLRMFPYHEIQAMLASRGWSTEKLPGTFRQRRFKHDRERAEVLSALEVLGLDPGRVEAQDDYLHAELFVSRRRDPEGD